MYKCSIHFCDDPTYGMFCTYHDGVICTKISKRTKQRCMNFREQMSSMCAYHTYRQNEKDEWLESQKEEIERYALEKDKLFLDSLNIYDKKTYHRWITKNHPDKGGDSEIFLKVMELSKMIL